MDRNRRIFFLLLINLTLAFISLYILDFLQIIDYRQILQRIPGARAVYKVKIEDPYLLERVELEKKWEILNEKTKNYEEDKLELETQKRELELEGEKLELERKKIEQMIIDRDTELSNANAYDKRVAQVARQIENMPPQAAVKILSQQEDLMIIDIFKKIEDLAKEAGTMSQVPYYLSLMDKEQAARVQRKMLE